MKAIIIIRTHMARADIIISELKRQIEELNWPMPLFARLEPVWDDPKEEIDVVRLDPEMDMQKYIESIKANYEFMSRG